VPPALVETMKGRVAATLDEMGVQAMANFVWALAQLRVLPPPQCCNTSR
jgi:hypothetical protein